MLKKLMAGAVVALAVVSSSAADLYPDGKLRGIQAGDFIQPTDNIGGYPIFQNDGNWTFVAGINSSSSGGSDPIKIGDVHIDYWSGGQLLAKQNIAANIGPGTNSSWAGSPCSPGHLVMRNKGRGLQDNCMTIDADKVVFGNTQVTFLKIVITNTGSNGRLYRIILGINADLLGVRDTGTGDWTESEIKNKPHKREAIERLTAWAEQIQDGSIKAFGYSKPLDVYANVPSLTTLLPVPEDLVGGKRSINFLSAVQHLRHLGTFKSIAYSHYEDYKGAWGYATDQPSQDAADNVAVAKCESLRSVNRPNAPKCEVYRMTDSKPVVDSSIAPQKQYPGVLMTVKNKSSAVAKLYWVNGTELRYYSSLSPGQTFGQHTYIGHQWRAVFSGDAAPVDFTASEMDTVWELRVPGQ